MGFFNAFSNENTTQNTAYNQQVGASQGSIAFGASSSGNSVKVSTVDPEIVEAALGANVVTSKAAIDAASGVSSLSIEAANSLAAKFADTLRANFRDSTNFASDSLTQATQAEQAAVAQTNNLVSQLVGRAFDYTSENTPGSAASAVVGASNATQLKTVLIVGAAIVLLAWLATKK